MSAIIPLYGYQRAWLKDEARLKVACWARQTGKSFSATLEAVLDCLQCRNRLWVLISRGERQAVELLGQAARHVRACQVVFRYLGRNRWEPDIAQTQIHFPNGSRIIALPANPDTVRGYSGHVVLDEFATHGEADELWRATAPIAARGYKIRVMSTPKGKDNRFDRVWQDPQWSRHGLTISQAIADGLAMDAVQLRAACQDEETWQQEFECHFLDRSYAYLPLDLIISAESPDCLSELQSGEYYAGIDVGRTHDLTAVWVLERVGDVLVTRRVDLLHGETFRAQFDFLNPLAAQCARVCIDAGGLGMQLAEELKAAHPERVEAVQFGASIAAETTGLTLPIKTHLAALAKRHLEERRVRLPQDHEVRHEFHALRRCIAPSGAVRFDPGRTGPSHADRFWAFALALAAATHKAADVKVRWF